MDIYILIFLGIFLIPIIAQISISINYKKYSRINNNKEISGFEVARKILDNNNLGDIHIVETKGNLTDHYDPKRKVIRLSHDIFHGTTIAAASIAAHECGHAIQDKENYTFMKIRSFIYPIVNFSSKIAYIVLIIGFIASLTNMIYIGIALVSLGVLFQLVTLPVEFNASRRAKEQLSSLSILDNTELEGSQKVLSAAALTYVAGLLASLLEIVRLVLIARDN